MVPCGAALGKIYFFVHCGRISIYYAVEQQFKFIPAADEQKTKIFNDTLLRMIPGLTQDEIDHFREAICGEINSQLSQSNLLKSDTVINTNTEVTDITEATIDNTQNTASTGANQVTENILKLMICGIIIVMLQIIT